MTRIRTWSGATLLAALLLLGAGAAPAQADDSNGLSLQVVERWNLVGRTGTWSPYVVTIRNDGAGTFAGDLALVPEAGYQGPFPPDSFPTYHTAVRVAPGARVSVTISAQEAQGGYHAELRDSSGAVVAQASASSATRGTAAIAVLSDVPNADQQIDAPLKTLSRVNVAVSRIPAAADLPTDAAHLSGLNGLVIDDFDTGALNQAQTQALKDFVALGGTLIEVGGGSWRRTLLALPAELLPMRPSATGTASLAPLAALGGIDTDRAAQVATGPVEPWAATAVAAPDGTPLIVEGAYGMGQVVELAFDPMASPFDTQVPLLALAWSQAITRGLTAAHGGDQVYAQAFTGQPGALLGSGPGSWSPFPGLMDTAFNSVPAPSSPPYGLLIVLLIGYVLLVSVFSYALLRRAGRRGLLWVSVPVLALVVSVGSYTVGFGTRGQEYQLVELQFQRLGPGGVMETDTFAGVLAPRRGDVRVTAPSGTLVSTFVPLFSVAVTGGQNTVVTPGPAPEVLFTNVAVFDMRPLQTLSVTHPPGGGLEAQLRLSQGRIQGQIVNRTSRTVRGLQLMSASGPMAQLLPELRPGETAAVDVPVGSSASAIPFAGKGGPVGPFGPGSDPHQALIQVAASQAAGKTGELALVGLTDPTGTLLVNGERPTVSAQAVVVESVRLASTDSASRLPSSARLVSSLAADGGQSSLDVYEVALPVGMSHPPAVSWTPGPGSGPTLGPTALEVYDWDHGTWRALSSAPGAPTALAAGETRGGVVRARVRESTPGQTNLYLTDAS